MNPLRRWGPQLLWIGGDLLAFAVAATLASLLLGRPPLVSGYAVLAIIAAVRIWFFVRTGMYRAVLRYSDVDTLLWLTAGTALGSVVGTFAGFFAFLEDIGGLGRVFLALEGMLALALVGGSRFAVRVWHERRARGSGERTLVLGAGATGETALRLLQRSPAFRPVGLIDDDPGKHGSLIHGCRVLGGSERLIAIARERDVGTVVVAAELDSLRLRELFRECMDHDLRLRVARDVDRMLERGEQPRFEDLALEDLMRRPARRLDPAPVRRLLAGKRVLVTGAGGSIGSDLARQAAEHGAARLVLVDHSEPSLYAVDRRLRAHGCEVVPVLLDLREREHLARVVAEHAPEVVFHAAAYKHVPMVECNAAAALSNNVDGFRCLLEVCGEAGVADLVLISSDKAVRPTNVMGASKRVCELMLRSWQPGPRRRCAVRFGNVLGSSGSVVPLFLEQIAAGGPVTVTHPEVTRYFMLIPEAVELVLQAAALADDGDLFLLDMGEPVRIDHLARQLIYMTGRVPERDVAIAYTGMRPGEKLHEELLLTGDEAATTIPGLLRARGEAPDAETVRAQVSTLLDACRHGDEAALVAALRALVPEWQADARWRDLVLK